ncbi:MAG: DUF6436 domain-containing protein [Cellvibrionaceae bacterium]|nr:DUF6436 domain-containing protein [Cellvibrionaceae bacterium]
MLRQELLAFAAIGILGSLALFALWFFEWRWLGRFDESLVQFDGERLPAIAAGRVTVQQFLDPSCPCNRYVQQHSEELSSNYGAQGVAFQTVEPSQNVETTIPSSPAVAIWTADGDLAYFGPYSNGVICNAKTSLIEPVLQSLQSGDNPMISNTAGVGCFCPWPDNEVSA